MSFGGGIWGGWYGDCRASAELEVQRNGSSRKQWPDWTVLELPSLFSSLPLQYRDAVDEWIACVCRIGRPAPSISRNLQDRHPSTCSRSTAHTARTATRVLRENYPGRLISLRGDLHRELTRFSSLWIFFMGIPEIPYWTEGEYSPSNRQHTPFYGGKNRPTLPNSGKSVYRQWGTPRVGYNF